MIVVTDLQSMVRECVCVCVCVCAWVHIHTSSVFLLYSSSISTNVSWSGAKFYFIIKLVSILCFNPGFPSLRHFLLIHDCFSFPGPPNRGLSLQNHFPQSVSRQFSHNPHQQLVTLHFVPTYMYT